MGAESRGLLITYESSHMAIRAERALKSRGLEVDLIPVPREISSACGFCLILGPAALEAPKLKLIRELCAPGREALWTVLELAGAGKKKERRYERIAEDD